MLSAVPFVSIDPGPIHVAAPDDPKSPSFLRPEFVQEEAIRGDGRPAVCVARLERLPGGVISRTCEGNKRFKPPRVPGSIHIAPIRPFSAFPPDDRTGRPFHELVLEGFPPEHEDEEPGQCYRFMVLNQCADHGLPEGGIVCFREMQPVPIRHALLSEKIARLSILSVGVLDQRLASHFQQSENDNAQDAAAAGADSDIVMRFKRKQSKDAERVAARSEGNA